MMQVQKPRDSAGQTSSRSHLADGRSDASLFKHTRTISLNSGDLKI